MLLVLFISPAVAADDGTQNGQDEWTESIVAALAGPAQQATHISLGEAVAAAVRYNPGMQAAGRDPQAARHGILEALSAFDPTISVDVGLDEQKVPTHNSLSGSELLEKNNRWGNLVVSKLMRSGANLDLSWSNERNSTNSRFQGLVPQYSPSLEVGLEQPLLRDFGASQASTTVRLARNATLQAAAGFESRLATFVAAVVETYWGYVGAEAEVRVKRRSLNLAHELVKMAEAKVKVGLLAPVVIREARAEAASRDEELISSEHRLELAARTLQYTVMMGAEGGRAPARLVPSDTHTAKVVTVGRATSIRTAIGRRAELKTARLVIENAKLAKKQAANQLLPSLNMVGNYTLVGLGGKAIPLTSITGGPDQTSGFGGSYADALDLMADGTYYRYTLGLKLEVPLSNAAARSRLARAEVKLAQARELLGQALSDVALEVESAVGRIASANKRVVAARLARELAEENLTNQKRRFEVGMVTTTDVLDFQEKSARARAAEVTAITDHAVALAALALAEGTLLEAYSINVEIEDAPGRPWWSRF